MTKTAPKSKKNGVEVLARYGSFYLGDDDEFAHCFILRGGRCILLFQGLEAVYVSTVEAPKDEYDRLVDLLDKGIPTGWPAASYTGYNFVTDAESAAASEIAVYGVQPGDARPPGEYYAAPADSDIGKLVKAIAKVDQPVLAGRR